MPPVKDDYGKAEFKEIGKLSSFFPAYVRQCCRALRDGTHYEVLDANRKVALKILKPYCKKYEFALRHYHLMEKYNPIEVQYIIKHLPSETTATETFHCHATETSIGLPKRACLHCPKVGRWIRAMDEGYFDEQRGNIQENP